jgi:hypothetical protein
MKLLRAFLTLSLGSVLRLTRQRVVVRSLAIPTILTIGTIVLTLIISAWFGGSGIVVLSPDLASNQPLRNAIQAEGWSIHAAAEPGQAIKDGEGWAGTDGQTLWVRQRSTHSLRFEELIRESIGASWRPHPRLVKPPIEYAARKGKLLAQLMSVLFVMYGVVLGAGLVARDRDQGILEAEFSMPIPIWMHAASRWFASTLILTIFLLFAVLTFTAFLSMPDQGAMIRHGLAGTMSSTALGLVMIGKAGIKQGFSGPVAAGISTATFLCGLGFGLPDHQAAWIPMASIASDSAGWEALFMASLFSLGAIFMFGKRSALG